VLLKNQFSLKSLQKTNSWEWQGWEFISVIKGCFAAALIQPFIPISSHENITYKIFHKTLHNPSC